MSADTRKGTISSSKKVAASAKANRTAPSAKVNKTTSSAKVNKTTPSARANKNSSSNLDKKNARPAKKGASSKYEGMPKSATVLAIERQKKMEQITPLAQITSELPVLGRNLDSPIRGPKFSRRMPSFRDIEIDWDPKRHMRLWVTLGVLLAILITGLVIISKYTVDTVIIEGNVHYTNDEIYSFVIGDKKVGTNSIYLSMKYKNKEIEDIPFIQTMSVKIVDSKTIKINVYEKALAGYIEYLDRYFYFDKDGTVVESTNIKTTGIPQVLGLNFDHVVMYEKLPLENEEIFGQILEMTQLLKKYEIEMDKIYFDKKYNMTLYFGDARIKVGTFDYIDEKIIKLKSILPELEGKSGVLRLDNYKGADDIITFEMDS